MTDPIRGGCACGRVRLTLIPPTLMLSHCHCRSCRSVHGAAFVTWTAVPPERMRIEGAEHLADYRSSQHVLRSFCAACGTHVRYMSGDSPDRVYVPAGVLADPLDRTPSCHVNVRDTASFCPRFADGLPAHESFD